MTKILSTKKSILDYCICNVVANWINKKVVCVRDEKLKTSYIVIDSWKRHQNKLHALDTTQ